MKYNRYYKELIFMSPLEQALYNFLLEHRCEVSDPEYPDFCRCAQAREAKLRAALTPAQAKLLDSLLLDAQLKAGAEREALFQSALRLGLELGRL